MLQYSKIFIIYLIYQIYWLFAFAIIDRRGPQFLVEPQNTVSFLNDTGSVITCSAKGTPQPTITWTKSDGSPLVWVPGLRQVRTDPHSSQLVYLPFAANQYRQDIHSVGVRCVATNTYGTIESRECNIRATVKQLYEVHVYDDYVIKGNTGVLRCHIPSFVREYIWVTNWLTSDGHQIHSNIENGGRFNVLPSGELHISRVDSVIDSQRQYRCQTKHKLSGEVKLSANSGRLIVTDSQTKLFPKMTTNTRYLVAVAGESVQLPCTAQGYPPPQFNWFKLNRLTILEKISSHSSQHFPKKIIQINGYLIIKSVSVDDSGKYVCICNNTVGQDRTDIELLVREPLNVILSPSHILVTDSSSVRLNCSVLGTPISRVVWKKNGKPISSNYKIKVFYDKSIYCLDIKQPKPEDKGIYQCFASNEFESVQSSAEISLASDPPRFTHVFEVIEPVITGSGLSLKCSATGLPLPQIVWTLDGQHISENSRLRMGDYVTSDGVVNSYINISNTKTQDGGLYECRASNDVHSISHRNRVNIFGPVFVRQLPNITAIAGHTVHIDCPFNGYPIETISWFKRQSNRLTKLPENHRQRSLSNGTLIISGVDSESDQHWYRCLVNGTTTSGYTDVYLRVLVAPVINPFLAPPNLKEGQRVLLTCAVIEGDPPVKLEFFKDDTPVRQNNNIRIDSSNEYSSTLFISNVTNEDSGNYSCIASNLAAKTTFPFNLNVNVPPKWIISPTDTEAIVGQNVIMNCSASGQPRVWWDRSDNNQVSGSSSIEQSVHQSFRTVISNSHMHTLENGSLTIKDVSEDDEGVYLCQANNGVGTGLSKVVTLKINVPAHFKSKFSAQTVRKGLPVLIVCTAFGEMPITIVVTKDRMQFDANLEPRYQLITNQKTDSFELTLKILECDRRDSSLFTCIAANEFGRDEFNTQIIVQEPPDRPESLSVIHMDSRSAQLSWITPYTGNSGISSYQLEYKMSEKSWESIHKTVQTIAGTDNSFTITGLKPITTYDIRIRAENKLGFSPYSQTPQLTTIEEVPSGSPLDVKVFPLSARSLQVTFNAPKPESRNGRLLGYYVGYKGLEIDEHFMFKKVSINEFSSVVNKPTEVVINGLKRSTKYAVIVQAFNSKGSGPQSEETIGETLVNDPPKAPTLSVINVDFNSIEISWSFDENEDNSEISGYYIYSKSQNKEWEEKQIASQTHSFVFEQLICGTQYQFYVIAYNSVGKGDPSHAIAVKTNGSGPTAPNSVETLLTVNTTSAVIRLDSWLPNGCQIKGFSIKYKSKYSSEWTHVSTDVWPEQTHIELMSLSAANWYALEVMAISDAGSVRNLYYFATLNTNGGTVSPLEEDRPLTYQSLTVIVPTTCSVIVLTVIIIVGCFVVNKRRPMTPNSTNQSLHSVHNCGDDSLTSDAFHLAVLEPRKSYQLSSDINMQTDGLKNLGKDVYFQSPYGLSRIQRQMYSESEMSSLQNTLRQTRPEHIYQMPIPPKWV